MQQGAHVKTRTGTVGFNHYRLQKLNPMETNGNFETKTSDHLNRIVSLSYNAKRVCLKCFLALRRKRKKNKEGG